MKFIKAADGDYYNVDYICKVFLDVIEEKISYDPLYSPPSFTDNYKIKVLLRKDIFGYEKIILLDELSYHRERGEDYERPHMKVEVTSCRIRQEAEAKMRLEDKIRELSSSEGR